MTKQMMDLRKVSCSGCGMAERNGAREFSSNQLDTCKLQQVGNVSLPKQRTYVNTNYWRRKRACCEMVGCILGLLVLLASAERITQAQDVSSVQSPPSQLFLSASSVRAPGSISIAVGRPASKRSKEEEEGFIMETASQLPTSAQATDATSASSSVPPQEFASSQEESNNDNQRIPIDADRQQFLTHDQLSLPEPTDNSSQDRRTSSRAGLSRISHVSSFLSDLFSFASLRGREQPGASYTQTTQDQRPEEEPAKQNNRAASKPLPPSPQPQPPPASSPPPTTCPGVCRSIITASLLCRNEIPNAPCPSVLQRCCERDEGGLASAFIGTPVETSPLIGASEPAQGGALASPTTLAPQADLPPPRHEIREHLSPHGDRSAPPASSTEPPSPPPSTTPSQQPFNGAVLYFLSSLNSSAPQAEQPAGQVRHQNEQPIDEEPGSGQSGSRPRQTSQSFDSPVSGGSSSKQQSTTSPAPEYQLRPVSLQTANGTIIHLPAGGLSHRLRPVVYANWSDYHHMTMHRPMHQQTFVYHSNIDPVKRLVALEMQQNLTSSSSSPTPTAVVDDTTAETTTPSSIKRTLIISEPQLSYKSRQTPNEYTQPQTQVLNDQQHSRQYSAESGDEAFLSSLATTTTTSTTTTTPAPSTTTTTTETPDGVDLSQSVASGVGSVLVNLIESWMGSSPTTTPSPAYYEDSYPQLTTFFGPTDQQSERNQQLPSSYMNSTIDDETNLGEDQDSNKCQGYCTLTLFTMLCDSTYRSSDCDANQKCCVINSSKPAEPPQVHQQTQAQSISKHSMCRGDCLSVYHSSICVKPNELIDSSSCLPGFVCCSPPSAGHQGLGVSKLDDTYSLDRPDQMSADSSSSEPVKESSSFLASLLPPLPPSLAGESSTSVHKVEPQYGGTRSSNEQKKSNQKSSSAGQSGGGIMSHIYQIFKPRQKNQQQQQQTHQLPAQLTPAMVSQLQDSYALQMASMRNGGLGGIQQTPLLYPAQLLAIAPAYAPQVPAPLNPTGLHNYASIPANAAGLVKEPPLQNLNKGVVTNPILSIAADTHTPTRLSMNQAYGLIGAQPQTAIYHQRPQQQPKYQQQQHQPSLYQQHQHPQQVAGAGINKLPASALVEAGQQLGMSPDTSHQHGLIVNGLTYAAGSQHLRTGGVMGQFPAASGAGIVASGQSVNVASDRPRNNQQQQVDNAHAQTSNKAASHNWSLSPFVPADARQSALTPSKVFMAQQQQHQQQTQQHQQPHQQVQVTVTRPPAVVVKQEQQQVERTQPRQPATCGLPGSLSKSGDREGRVMGGFEAKPNHWCWMAALMNGRNEYLCGGALIGGKWVLTSAHCVTQHLRDASQLYVKLGQHNLNSSDAGLAKTIQVKTSYVHHSHNSITLDNDIALLRLEEAVDLDEPTICTVCLPDRNSKLEPGKRCTVTGYGFENESGPAALRVRQTDLPVVGDAECQRRASNLLGKPFALPASSFCAGGELGQDACHGDGGSPLSCLVDGYYELAGIVSWGYKCGSKDLPGLYSKVSAFVGWINQIVSVNN